METTPRTFFHYSSGVKGLSFPQVPAQRSLPISIAAAQNCRTWVWVGMAGTQRCSQGCAGNCIFCSFPHLQIKSYLPFLESCSVCSEFSAPQCIPMKIKGCAQSSTTTSSWRKNFSSSVSQSTHTDFSGTTKLNTYFLIFISAYGTC